MLLARIHCIDMDSWYWQGIMVWTWTHSIGNIHGIDLDSWHSMGIPKSHTYKRDFHWLGALARVSLIVTMSVAVFFWCHAPMPFFCGLSLHWPTPVTWLLPRHLNLYPPVFNRLLLVSTHLHRCSYPHTPRELVSPVCRIFISECFTKGWSVATSSFLVNEPLTHKYIEVKVLYCLQIIGFVSFFSYSWSLIILGRQRKSETKKNTLFMHFLSFVSILPTLFKKRP